MFLLTATLLAPVATATKNAQVPTPNVTTVHGSPEAFTLPTEHRRFFLDSFRDNLVKPIRDLLCTGFGKFRSEFGGYYGVGNSDQFTVESSDVYNLKLFYRGKTYGKSYWAYWNQVAMDYVMGKWNVAKQNTCCMGISMGACGTWYQGAFYGDCFAALSPSGAFVEPEFLPWEKIKTPTLYVGGTEDRNGFDLMLEAYNYALKHGAKIERFIAVGGAPHGVEWPMELIAIYDFFESHLS